MTEMQLVPLNCLECRQPIPAQPDEVAWVCSECGKGQRLSEQDELIPLEVHYSEAIEEGETGRPFWVVAATIGVSSRMTAVRQGQDKEFLAAKETWDKPQCFFIPAFNLSIEALLSGAKQQLFQPPTTNPGKPAVFGSVTRRPKELQPLIEFVVMSIEAEREDKLSHFKFIAHLEEPEFWVLP